MTLTSAGNVGIGTTSPNAYSNLTTLTVNGTNGSVIDLTTGGTLYGELYSLVNELRVDAVGASSRLGLFTNSTERMRITSGGNVLIGTTTDAGFKFDVNGTGRFSGNLSVGNGTTAVSLGINRGAAGDGNGLRFQTAGTNNWYVGSAATSTNTDLEIYNHNTATTNLRLSYSTGAATFSSSVTATGLFIGTSNGQVGDINSTNANGGYLTWSTSGTVIADIGTAQQIFGSGGSTTFGINARGSRDLVFGSNNTERMRITSGGNVGIGTTSPSWMLEINKDTSSGSFGQYPAISINNPNASGFSAYYFFSGATNKAGIEYSNSANNLLIFSNGAERMRITSGGNVGINTTSPQDRLDVNGSIRFRANTPDFVAVANSGVIDYVSTSLFPTDPCIRIAAIGSSTVPASIRFQVGSTTTGPIERLRLTPSGVLGFNGDSLESSGGFDKFSLGFSVGNYAWIQSWGGNVIYLNKQGNAVYAGTQRIDNNSDARIKENITSIPNALSTVLTLTGRKFNMMDEDNILRYGFIAQEVQPHLNDFVTESERSFEKDGIKIENLLTLESSGAAWGALLVEAIKELKSELDTAKQEIAELKLAK
jgi:hypothetical protein